MSLTSTALVGDDRFLNYMCYAATALCCYDYCLTFEREVVLMWRDKLTAASALFYALRYAALLNTILILLGYLSWPGWQTAHSCMIIMRLQMAGDVLILTCVAAFATMRIYALFRRSWALSYLILALSLVNPAISMYTFIISTPILLQVTPTYQTCSIDTPYASNLWMMGARASAVVSDSLVLFLTWRGTRHVAASELRTILMSHTAVYFGFLFLLNFGGICIAIAQLLFIDAISTLTAVLTSVFLSRLMLDLRLVVQKDDQWTDTPMLSTVETLVLSQEHGWIGAMELSRSNQCGSDP